MKRLYIILAVFIGLFFLDFSIRSEFPLVDDLITYKDSKNVIEGKISTATLFKNYPTSPGRMVRPLSGVYMASMISVTQWFHSPQVLYFFSSLMFLFMLWGIYTYSPRFIDNSNSFFVVLLALIITFPFSSSTLFAPMLSMVSFLWILYILSIYLITKNNWGSIVGSGLLVLISSLTVEYFIPLLLINSILIFYPQKNRPYLKWIIAVGLPMILFFIFRNVIAPQLYDHFYNYTSERVDVSWVSIANVFIGIFKTYTIDYLYVIIRAFKAMVHYTWTDGVLGLILLLFCLFFIQHKLTFKPIKKKELLLYLLFFGLTYSLFFITKYKPSLFSFYNRTMGLVRISNSLIGLCFLVYIYHRFTSELWKKAIQIGLTVLIFINGIIIISEKNAWIYAGKYNAEVIQQLHQSLEKKPLLNTIVTYSHQNDSHFVTDEPTLKNNYEFLNLFKIMNYQSTNCERAFFKNEPTYYILGHPFNTYYKSNFNAQNNQVTVNQKSFHFPLYVFNYNQKKLILLSNIKEFNLYNAKFSD